MIFKNKKRIGLHIGANVIYGVEATQKGKPTITREWKRDCVVALTPLSINELISSTIAEWGLKGSAISVSIPDSIVRVAILDFEDLPKRRGELTQFILARSAKTHGVDASLYSMDFQMMPFGKRVLSVMVNRDIVKGIEVGASNAGCAVNKIVPESFNLTNFLPEDNEDGAIIINGCNHIICCVFASGVIDFYRCKTAEDDSERVKALTSSFAFYSGKNLSVKTKNTYLFSNSQNKAVESSINEILPSAKLVKAQAYIAETAGIGVKDIEALAALGACLD